MSELDLIKKNIDLLVNLHQLIENQGYITLEQFNNHKSCLPESKHIEFYSYLDTKSLIDLAIQNTNDSSLTISTLIQRLKQQQQEIDVLRKQLSETSKDLRLAKKLAGLEDKDPF